MEQTQLFELIRALSVEEMAQLQSFSNIPFFNNDRMKAYVAPLISICLDHLESTSKGKLEKSDVYHELFQGQTFVEGKLEKVMVEAQKLIRSFLLTQHYFREGNEFHQVLDFAKIVRTRGLNNRYDAAMSRLEKVQVENPYKNVEFFHNQFLLEGTVHYMECLNNQAKGDLNIPNVLYATEIYYYMRRVALLSRYLLQLKFTKLDIPEFVKKDIDNILVPDYYLDESPILRINFEIFNILKKGVPDISDVKLIFDLLLELLQRNTLIFRRCIFV